MQRTNPQCGGRAHRPIACVMGEIDLVRALALADISSAVFIDPGNPARFSHSTVEALNWADPWREPTRAVERLLAFGHAQPAPPVLFYDGDWDLLTVSRYRDELRTAFRFVVSDATLVEQLVDKASFQALADRQGLPVPRGYRLLAGAELPDVELKWPVVVKPLTRQHANWRPLARAKALKAHSRDDLQRIAEDLARAGVDVMVQEEVGGPEHRIASYHVYVDEGGDIAAEFTGRKLRTFPADYGYSTALAITQDPETAALGRDVVTELGLRGVAKLDFKRDDRDRLHLLEINPRFNLWHYPGALAGVNVAATVYADLVGLPRPRQLRPVRPVIWCNLRRDLRAARDRGMSTVSWLSFAARAQAKSGFAPSDPLPLARAAVWRARHRLRRSAHRARCAEVLPPGRAAALRVDDAT